MVSGMKQDQMERQLLEELSLSKYQQQHKMEGQPKESPPEESQEQAEDVSEQHDEAEEPPEEQLSKYPQCHSGRGCCGKLAEDEWSEEQQPQLLAKSQEV